MGTTDPPYLTLDPAIEAAIYEDRAQGRKNPLAFDERAIVRRSNKAHDEATLARPAFVRDIEKIINLPAYNRYADKTQVFSFMHNDEISRRGLHVQLVSRVARGIGSLLGLNESLIEAIALGHDVGHTPFGHAGERFLNDIYHRETGNYFNHNVHSVRVLDRLYPRNISLQTLDGVLCHNGEFEQQVLRLGSTQDFETFDELVAQCHKDESTIAHLRPSTLEGCVVRVSDMIAYLGKDRQDALAIGVLDSLDTFESTYIGADNARIINNLTIDIVNHSYGKDTISLSEEAFLDLKTAKRQNYDEIYLKEGMVEGAQNVVEEMFNDMYELLRSDVQSANEDSPFYLHHIESMNRLSHSFDLNSYLEEGADMVVVDYIASMTDSYFMALYDYLFPRSQKTIMVRDFCSDLPPRE